MMTTADVLSLVKTRLGSDATLTAIVPAASIRVADQRQKATYPHIAVSVVGGTEESGNEGSLAGYIDLTIYSTDSQPFGQLNSICSRIKTLLHNKPVEISSGTNRVDAIFETRESGMMAEENVPDLYFMAVRYEFLAQIT